VTPYGVTSMPVDGDRLRFVASHRRPPIDQRVTVLERGEMLVTLRGSRLGAIIAVKSLGRKRIQVRDFEIELRVKARIRVVCRGDGCRFIRSNDRRACGLVLLHNGAHFGLEHSACPLPWAFARCAGGLWGADEPATQRRRFERVGPIRSVIFVRK
jgi:hypothetical protein